MIKQILIFILFCSSFVACSTPQIQQHKVAIPSNPPALLNFKIITPNKTGPYPVVILMHGCGGLEPSVLASLQSHAAFLKKNDFASIILNSFGPRRITNENNTICSNYSKLAEARTFRTFDAFAVKTYLESLTEIDGQNIFLMGQSNGGSVALLASNLQALSKIKPHISGPFRAVAAYYPWCGVIKKAKIINPVIIFGGQKDTWTPIFPCVEHEKRPENVNLHVVVYPDATHSFDLDIPLQTYAGQTVGGNLNAKNDSQKRMLAFFKLHLK